MTTKVNEDQPNQSGLDGWLRRHVPEHLHNQARHAWKRGWRSQIAWVKENLPNMRDDGAGKVSINSQASLGQFLQLAFEQLREEGYKINNILSLNRKHLTALFNRWEMEQLKPGTITDRRSKLSVYANAIGKGGMVPSVNNLGVLNIDPAIAKRVTVARVDKTWPQEAYDQAVKEAHIIHYRYGLIFEMERLFSLHGFEALCLEPHKADCDTYLHVYRGTRGGRPRDFPINEARREILDRCKFAVLDKSDSLSGKARGLKNAKSWYKACNIKFCATLAGKYGKTLDGLRHAGIHEALLKNGIDAPVKAKLKLS